MKGRWRPANSEHAETEQVVGRDGGRRKKSDERHWGASARDRGAGARETPSRVTRGLLPEPESRPTYWPPYSNIELIRIVDGEVEHSAISIEPKRTSS
uniref:Uncharacterized protein n=1 Tax=Globodera pallida TaxID=36090 RepID=A0A183C4N1_GLOPA